MDGTPGESGGGRRGAPSRARLQTVREAPGVAATLDRMAQASGLRERKKKRTRDLIMNAGRELFVVNGYEETTLQEIADRADVSISTIFTHFPAKIDILFAGIQAVNDDFVKHMRARPTGEPAIEATIRWHALRRERTVSETEERWQRNLNRLVDADPILSALKLERYNGAQKALAEAVAHDLSERPDDLRPRFIAVVKAGLLIAASGYSAANELTPDEQSQVNAYADECLRAAANAILAVPKPSVTPDQHQSVVGPE
jgi:AcrR family transcriptional regulator